MEEQIKYVLEYQQRAVRYQRDIAAALMGALSQCASRLQITKPLPILPGFEAPPPPAGPPANEEDHEEKEDDENGQGEEGPDEIGQGDEEVGQDKGIDDDDE